jgi:hypothetical protein
MELRPHWRVDMYMPEVEGCAPGASAARQTRLVSRRQRGAGRSRARARGLVARR